MITHRRVLLNKTAFSPTNLRGLKFWGDLSDINKLYQDSGGSTPVTADGDPIGKSTDKSGLGNHFTQATTSKKPTYKTGVQASKSAALFATDDYLDGNNNATPLIPTTADWVIYGALKTGANVTNWGNIFAQYVSVINNGRFLVAVNAGKLSLFLGSDAGGNSNAFVDAGNVSINTTYIFSFSRISSVFTGRLNAVNGTPYTPSFSKSLLQVGNLIGAYSDSVTTYNGATITDLFNGHLFDFIVQVATPDSNDIANTESYLNTKLAVY